MNGLIFPYRHEADRADAGTLTSASVSRSPSGVRVVGVLGSSLQVGERRSDADG